MEEKPLLFLIDFRDSALPEETEERDYFFLLKFVGGSCIPSGAPFRVARQEHRTGTLTLDIPQLVPDTCRVYFRLRTKQGVALAESSLNIIVSS